MEFDQLLERITALLLERERVSFAALRQYFDLDDGLLDAVKAELIDARGVARNEDDRVLVRAHPRDLETSAAERRNLTVMFVDIVGSTELAARLDPEDLRSLVRNYQLTVGNVVRRYDGYIAQYLGDGLLVYFGYPVAHEDDARRAVIAAVGAQGAMNALNERLEREHDTRIALRIGVHTGLVVVGEVGDGERQEALALGKTPNIAARLQALAAPGAVVISPDTRTLVRDRFELTSLGEHELKGIPGTVEVFQVGAATGVSSRFDSAVTDKLLPLVGRRRELDELVAHWEQARRGRGGAVLLSGEAGIGKSRLMQALKEYVISEDSRWVLLRASPYHRNTPLYPVISLWRQALGLREDEDPQQSVEALRDNLAQFDLDQDRALRIVTRLLQIPQADGGARSPIDLPAIVGFHEQILTQMAQAGPALVVLEDLHWADPSSIELARRFIRRAAQGRILLLLTARPEFDATRLGVDAISMLSLERLPRADVEQMVSTVADGRTFDASVMAEIIRRTDGVPAFIEELTRMLVESDWLRDDNGHIVPVGPIPAAIPATLKDSLMARLDRLGDAKQVAQQAAVVGRSFPRGLLATISDLPAERLDASLAQLVRANVLRRKELRGEATYVFRHTMLQEAAYLALLKAARQDLHLRIGNALEQDFASLVEQQPERVALHFERAGAVERAIGYWQWAGEQAVERGANVEAIAHLEQGMTLLGTLPPAPLRDQRELALLTIMGPAMVQSAGWAAPRLGDIYGRAMEIIASDGSSENIDFQVLGGLCAWHLQRGELATVHALAERLMRQAQRHRDDQSMVVAHVCLAVAAFYRADAARCREHCASVSRLYQPGVHVPIGFLYGQDPSVIADNILATQTWLAGDSDGARRIALAAQDRARAIPTPFSLYLANAWYARLLFEMGDYADALALAARVGVEAGKKNYQFVMALTDLVAGAVHARTGDAAGGVEQIERGIALWRAGGNELSLSYFYALLARAKMQADDHKGASGALAAGFEAVERRGEFLWQAELYRLYGELLADREPAVAREHLERGVKTATQQGATTLAVRSALALARILDDRGDDGGRAALATVLGGLAEETDGRVLAEAREYLGAAASRGVSG